MSSSTILAAVARDEGFQRRVQHYMHKESGVVLAEALATAGHTARVAYANLVVTNEAEILSHAIAVMSVAAVSSVANTSSIDNGISDAILEAAVSSTWNIMANVETGS